MAILCTRLLIKGVRCIQGPVVGLWTLKASAGYGARSWPGRGRKEKELPIFIYHFVRHAAFIKSHPFHAVYLGGGTPSVLSHENLLRLLKAIQEHLPLANDCEITVEGRVYHFSDDGVFACIEGGKWSGRNE